MVLNDMRHLILAYAHAAECIYVSLNIVTVDFLSHTEIRDHKSALLLLVMVIIDS